MSTGALLAVELAELAHEVVDALHVQPQLGGQLDLTTAELLRAVQAAAELREVVDEAVAILVRQAQRGGVRPTTGRAPSDARLAAVLDMSTSAFSRRYGLDTWERRQSPLSRRRDDASLTQPT